MLLVQKPLKAERRVVQLELTGCVECCVDPAGTRLRYVYAVGSPTKARRVAGGR